LRISSFGWRRRLLDPTHVYELVNNQPKKSCTAKAKKENSKETKAKFNCQKAIRWRCFFFSLGAVHVNLQVLVFVLFGPFSSINRWRLGGRKARDNTRRRKQKQKCKASVVCCV
jgi:hypothetical protein